MTERPQSFWIRYGLAVGTVVVAALVTAQVPLLHERFTLFLFWPFFIALAWFGGPGPALVAKEVLDSRDR